MAARFIFSTALVVVMLLALALPDNPLNLMSRLAVGTAGVEQWIVLGGIMVIILALGFVTHTYAEIIGKSHHSG
jgi:ABC-2 type transport system permease protein